MDHRFLFALFLFATVTTAATIDRNDVELMIREVVDKEAEYLLNAEHHFTNFKSKFNKNYATKEEHDYRLGVFKSNFIKAKVHQKLDPTAQHGITKFSDLTESEFRSQFLGLKNSIGQLVDLPKAPILPTNNLPKDFDWREKGAVTPVKNQGNCSSCWAFSAIGALEGANFLATGKLVSLSEQQLLDCDHVCDPAEAQYGTCDTGCVGGVMNNAFKYLLQSGGIQREQDYSYTANNGTCKFDKSKVAVSLSNFSVISPDEDQIAANLVKYGPLTVAVSATWMQTYRGGISCTYICGKLGVDGHGVVLVGYGSAGYAPIRFKQVPYWILKNSWGEKWGEKGYYMLCRGHNACGVNLAASTVSVV